MTANTTQYIAKTFKFLLLVRYTINLIAKKPVIHEKINPIIKYLISM
jgi:hypothetical protein